MDLSEKALWQAVLKRDRRYDGICFYGVMSTFIYCRFHCPSKRPLLENTRFFFSSEIASAIGQPKAIRAVARACATNPVAIVIPCHRVVHKTGGVGGYRWGPERKSKLLAMEKQTASSTTL